MEGFDISAFLMQALLMRPELTLGLVALGFLAFFIKGCYHDRKMEAMEMAKLTEQKEFNDYLKDASVRQDVQLEQQKGMLKNLGTTIDMLRITFEKVSDKLAAHDERSVQIASHVHDINSKMATQNSIKQINSRIDLLTEAILKDN